MKVRKVFIPLLAIFLSLPVMVRAEGKTLAGKWTQIEAGNTTIRVEEFNTFIDQLDKKLDSLEAAPHEEGTVFDYSYSIINRYEESSKAVETVNVDKTFATKDEAEEYYNEIEEEGKTNPQIKAVYDDSTEVIACEGDCEGEEPAGYICEILPPVFEEIEKTFTSLRDVEAYEPEELDGFKFVSKSETTTFNVPKPISINENGYDTPEDAQDALDLFTGSYGGSGTITKYRDSSKDVVSTVTGTDPYDSEPAANTAATELQATLDSEDFDGKRTVIVRPGTLDELKQYTIESFVSETFNSDTLALAYLDTLRGLGYTIDSYTITPIVTLGTGNVTAATKIDANLGEYVLPIDTTYVLLKQANAPKDDKKGKPEDKNKTVVVWTPTELSASAKLNFATTYKQYNIDNDIDGSTKGDLNIIFKFGYGTFDLSTTLGNTWGTYSFNIVDGSLKVKNPGMKLSHIVYGTTDLDKTFYSLTGLMSRTEPRNVWYLDVNVLTYGYSYNVTATGTDYDENYKVVYTYIKDPREMECSIPSYELIYDVETITTINYMKIDWFVGSQFLGAGGTNPPDTGLYIEDTSYNQYYMISFLGLVGFLSPKKKISSK